GRALVPQIDIAVGYFLDVGHVCCPSDVAGSIGVKRLSKEAAAKSITSEVIGAATMGRRRSGDDRNAVVERQLEDRTQRCVDLVRRHRPREQKALQQVAAELLQQEMMIGCLDAFD